MSGKKAGGKPADAQRGEAEQGPEPERERITSAKARQGIVLTALTGLPAVRSGDDLAALVDRAAAAQHLALADGVLVVCQKIVSKAEGRIVALGDITPSDEARRIAAEDGKDPRHIEVVLQESVRIVRRGFRTLITETHHGFVCANAGVDLSNAPETDTAVLLPIDPDASARSLRAALEKRGHGPLAVIVSDTFGRPWREGLVDVALGCAGIAPIDDLRGESDWVGRPLEVTATATADQLAAAAGLLMRKDAGIPAIFVTGVALTGDGTVRQTLRNPATDLFR
jgi:coenzyme F420-0:L-glutamate ligase/coenzyme F420-1:gamma-L-glutamate ligase